MKNNVHLLQYLAKFFLEWEIFQTKFIENIKTHILYSINFLENPAVYEIIWKSIIELGGYR
jgi:hypothetical protein